MLDLPRRSAALADIPELLYRYQGISDFRNEVDMLERHRLWFASPRTLNDPFECRPHFVFSKNSVMSEEQALIVVAHQAPANSSAEERDEYVARLVVNSQDPALVAIAQDQFRREIQERLYGVSTKSFSSNPNNILQWAHYADSHRGYCVGFAFQRPWTYTNDDGVNTEVALSEITYSEAYPQFDGDIDFRNPDTDEWFVSGLLTKSPHWIYEEEWRALRINCRPSYQTFSPGSLKQIILGGRMHRRDRRELLAMIEVFPLPIEVLEAREAQGSYAIEFHAI